MTVSDQMDLLVEQVKMLSGEIAFSTSTLKRLVEQSVTDPESCKTQVNPFVVCMFISHLTGNCSNMTLLLRQLLPAK